MVSQTKGDRTGGSVVSQTKGDRTGGAWLVRQRGIGRGIVVSQT